MALTRRARRAVDIATSDRARDRRVSGNHWSVCPGPSEKEKKKGREIKDITEVT